jgi:hypothetical protein
VTVNRIWIPALLLAVLVPGLAARSADEPADVGPRVGEYVVVHHLTWLHRAPSVDSEKWADNATRAVNQTDYLVFRVSEVREEWIQVVSFHAHDADAPRTTCYRTLDGMADLGLALWIARDQLQRVNRVPLDLPQGDGSSAAVAPGVVVQSVDTDRADGAATIHEHGLRIPVRVAPEALGLSYVAGDPLPREEGHGLVLDPGLPVRFAGAPLDLSGAVGILWLHDNSDGAVEIYTSCGHYRLHRERPEPTVSAPGGSEGSLTTLGSLEGVGLLMLRGGGESGEASLGDLFAAIPAPSVPPVLVVPAGTAMSWPDGTPLGTLPRDLLLFDQTPTSEGEGRTCYRPTLGSFPCEACTDNVTVCFPTPAD